MKTIGIEISEVPKSVYLQIIDNNKLKIVKNIPEKLDVEFRGPLGAYLTYVLTKDKNLAIQSGLSISGDLEAAQKLQRLLFGLNINWQERLSLLTGDIVAEELTITAKKTLQDLKEMISEYIIEEKQLVPNSHQVDDFMLEVDELSSYLDRLEARYTRIMQNQYESS